MEEPDKTNDSVNLKSFLCCQEYSKLCCQEKDHKLSILAKVAKSFHHLFCFTCRRFSKQMLVIDAACKTLLDKETESCKLSEDVKTRIKSSMTD
jgi:hypothetical protein